MFQDAPSTDTADPIAAAVDATSADAVVAWAAVAVPGPTVVAELASHDQSELSEGGRLDAILAVERQLRWLTALQHRLIAAHVPADAAIDDLDRRMAVDEISCTLTLSRSTADCRAHLAHALTRRLPATLAAVATGEVGGYPAQLLAEAVIGLPDDKAHAVEQAVLPHLPTSTPGQLHRRLARAVLRADPQRAQQSLTHAQTERRVACTPSAAGMAELWALLPAEGATAIMTAVNALASLTSADDPRTIDQRRADALVDLGIAALHDPALPRAQGQRPAINVTVALSTLLGVDDHPPS